MSDHEDRFEVRLPAHATSVRVARRFVGAVLEELVSAQEGDLVETALLLVSELATNAVLHARTPFRIVIDVDAGCVRVEVHDGSPVLPARRPYTVTASTGRGIAIVHDLAAEDGAERVGGGKVVWFELSRAGADAAASAAVRRFRGP